MVRYLLESFYSKQISKVLSCFSFLKQDHANDFHVLMLLQGGKPRSFLGKIYQKVDYMRYYMQGIDDQIRQDISLMENKLGRAINQSTERNILNTYERTLIELVESHIRSGCSETVISWALSGDNTELLRRPADPEAIAIKESRLMCLQLSNNN